ncbi:hypothetical protein KC331_g5796 [Hortaea werneckii]|uniref:Uncharacterized protein n=1 Tax=Hortaea werneckii TaxID=91943 RepID=A0A3M7CC80_HORWE|nr:hypothetical protein KC331_g5796 [Hortaea werneckii]KAI7716479.1 hypothetical protein KC353_g5347 [Hortaea werneckii]RMY49782.1 hypothetical protein D0865_07292 [Hortaea werneckii]
MTDNSTHLCGGEALASTSDSPQHAVATPPKRVNFPLPRELRDQIYGYLLHHEFTEHSTYPESDMQDAGLPSSYKFHTSILAVNTQIREEATEVFRSNDFVQVTTNWPVLKKLKALKVPIVSDLSCRNHEFEHLRIEYKLHVHSSKIPNYRERKLVVVRFGLIKLCRFLQFELLGFPSFGPVVLYGTGPKESRQCQVIRKPDERYNITSAIIVHDRVGKPLSTTTKRRLLEPFHNLIIGGQSMEINMILPEHELATFKLFVAPPVTNSLPMMWRSFELALEMKAVADRHVLTGHSDQALWLYRHIVFAGRDIPRRKEGPTMVLDVLCALVSIDTALCLALICLTRSRPMDAEYWLQISQKFLKGIRDSVQAFFPYFEMDSVESQMASGRYMAIQWLAMLCRNARNQLSALFKTTRKPCALKKDVRAIMVLNNHENVANYFEHDVNYLKTLILKNDGTAAEQAFDKNKLSLFQFPPLAFNFPLPEGWSKPVGWFGFLDREVYEDMLSKGLVSAP